jgi:hypothetical protein
METNFVPFARRRTRRLAERDSAQHSFSGLAEDGEVVRVPLTMMDRALVDGLREKYPPAPQTGTALTQTEAENELADIRDRRRRKRVAYDPMGRVVGTVEEEADHQVLDSFITDAQAALHRPGFRCLDDRSASEAAYAEYCRELQDAWKPRDSTGSEKLPPYGAQPLWAQKEGASCSIDGRRGVWKREGDFLFCRPVDEKLPKPAPGSTGAQPGTREYVDQVWRQMVLDQQNAWKTP